MSLLEKTLELEIEKIAHGGVCVARYQGRVIFVSGAIPGEKVLAEVTEDTGKNFARAVVTEVLVASPDRVPHFWRAARQGAGGAEFGHVSLSRQRELKTEVLKEALERMASTKLDVQVLPAPGDDENNGLHYRTRVQLNVDDSGTAGPTRERSHEVIFTKQLPLAVTELEELGLHLKNWQGVRKISMAASSTGQVHYLVDKKLHGPEVLLERVRSRTFRLSPGSFWQVHKSAPNLLAGKVIDYLKLLEFDTDKKNLDLYSGAGLFSATAAAEFPNANFLAVESSAQSVSDGKKSAQDLRGLKFVRSDVLLFLREQARLGNQFDTVILDPPRSGAATKVMSLVAQLSPRNIVYIACDPVALARDLKLLFTSGYQLKTLSSYDIFPHTHHFECVAALTKVA